MPEYATINNLRLPDFLQAAVDPSSYREFLDKLCQHKNARQAVFTFPISCNDPLPCLQLLDPQQEFLFYREKPDQSHVIAAGGSLIQFSGTGPERFSDANQFTDTVKKETLHFNATTDNDESDILFLGGFSFFDESEIGWDYFKPASLVLARRLILKHAGNTTLSVSLHIEEDRSPQKIHHHLKKELQQCADVLFADNKTHFVDQTKPIEKCTEIPLHSSKSRESTTHLKPDFKEWRHSINKVKAHIATGNFEKIVLARELTLSSQKICETETILNKLRTRYPNCCTFLVKQKHSKAFIGCSPEILLNFDGNSLQTEALAGSMARGANEQEDTSLENKLLNSYKNLDEHKLVIKYIKEQFRSVVKNVCVSGNPRVKKIANVQHLYSPIRAEKIADISPLQILGKLHPTPALGGYPRENTFNYLLKNKLANRGWFGAPVGWISSKGTGEFSVAIRSGLVGEHSARLFAGCGIVADSDPKTEWKEGELKFIPMLSALHHE